MQFQSARPDVVQAVNQRWLLKQWNELRSGAALPLWQQVPFEEFEQENLGRSPYATGNCALVATIEME